jgi:hypothetical protein
MPNAPHFKPSHEPIKEYYAALEAYGGHEVSHEIAIKTAFPHSPENQVGLLPLSPRRLN